MTIDLKAVQAEINDLETRMTDVKARMAGYLRDRAFLVIKYIQQRRRSASCRRDHRLNQGSSMEKLKIAWLWLIRENQPISLREMIIRLAAGQTSLPTDINEFRYPSYLTRSAMPEFETLLKDGLIVTDDPHERFGPHTKVKCSPALYRMQDIFRKHLFVDGPRTSDTRVDPRLGSTIEVGMLAKAAGHRLVARISAAELNRQAPLVQDELLPRLVRPWPFASFVAEAEHGTRLIPSFDRPRVQPTLPV